ncbi:MAG: GNAT family N-acetyltransferase [Dehalococcoidales bacterium]|nr:GNAT family N-acetyltransferase [Dehalococcoidales bacterium]
MEITIREYKDSDREACCALEGELAQRHAEIYEDPSIAAGDPGKAFDEYMARTDRCGTWVAESGDGIIGYAGLIDTVGEEGTAEIEPVVISSGARGGGVGTKLIQHVVDTAKEKGFRFLTIRPVLRNEEAFNLYVRLGFDHVGSIELFRDLDPESQRTWKSGITIHGKELKY